MTENENFTWQESEDNKFNEESNSNETSEQLKKETNFKKIENIWKTISKINYDF